MTVKWLVENFDADNKLWRLIEELKKRNQPLEIVDYYPFALYDGIDKDGNPAPSVVKDDECVVFMGSIQMALWVKHKKPWVPGLWLERDKLKCTNYYSYLGKYLFNQGYQFTTIGEYKREHESFFKTRGVQDCLFIRPDSGMKSFTGQIFKKENHATDWNFFDVSTKPEDIIVVAIPQVIKSEYRVVIADGEPITASLYQKDGKREQFPGAPKQVMALAKEIAAVIDKEMNLGPMYVIDIAEKWEGGYALMEINCFNCAGLYECDKGIVVDAANRIAEREYKEYQKV